MSVATEPAPQGTGESCAHCAAPLVEDQEWCLECGTARTVIHPPGDWRIPFAIVAAVIALALAALVLVLNGLSGDAKRRATAQVATPATSAAAAGAPTAAAATASTPSPPVTAGSTPTTPSTATSQAPQQAQPAIAGWPIGLGGWTVILATSTSRASAEATARRVASAGTRAGVLNSSDHPNLTPGLWVVFSGRYPTGAAALTAAAALRAAGHPLAHARMVAPPGG